MPRASAASLPRSRRSAALGYPPQPCGRSYADFRAGWTFKEAYDHVAFRQGSKGVSTRAVQRELRKLKELEYELYQQACAFEAPAPEPVRASRLADCVRVCRRGVPCGATCIPRGRTCRKKRTVACAFEEYQGALSFETAEERAAREWESGPRDEEGGDTSFDFDFMEREDEDLPDFGFGRARRRRPVRRRAR